MYFREISGLIDAWSKDSRLLSVEQDKFQFNTCRFVEVKTGRKGVKYREAGRILREISFVKNEQSKILYEAIEKQRTEIALQQQIVTCLEYRHVLECLPQKRFPAMVKLPGTDSGTGAWQKMWRLAVEDELDRMIEGYINSTGPALPPPSTKKVSPQAGVSATGATSSATIMVSKGPPLGSTHSKKPPSLRALLQSDFDHWSKGSSQLAKDKNDKKVPTTKPVALQAVPGGAGGPAISGAVPPTHGPKCKKPKGIPSHSGTWTTGNFIRVEVYKPDYETWRSFQTGYNLYGELSANIHTYGKSFDVHEINFTKSHRIILQWLNPKTGNADSDFESGDVNWEQVWRNKGLPSPP